MLNYPVDNLVLSCSGSKKDFFYQLHSITLHFGETCANGHYLTMRRKNTNYFNLYDDNKPPQEYQIFCKEYSSESTQILFYKRTEFVPPLDVRDCIFLDLTLNEEIDFDNGKILSFNKFNF